MVCGSNRGWGLSAAAAVPGYPSGVSLRANILGKYLWALLS
jgi:hypothetical protein